MQVADPVGRCARAGRHDETLSGEFDDGRALDAPSVRWNAGMPNRAIMFVIRSAENNAARLAWARGLPSACKGGRCQRTCSDRANGENS